MFVRPIPSTETYAVRRWSTVDVKHCDAGLLYVFIVLLLNVFLQQEGVAERKC